MGLATKICQKTSQCTDEGEPCIGPAVILQTLATCPQPFPGGGWKVASSVSSLWRAEDDSAFKETSQSHRQWRFVNFSTVQINVRTTQSRSWFNDVQTRWAFFLSGESSNVHINHSHWIYRMFSSVFWQFKSSSTQTCFGPCCFF